MKKLLLFTLIIKLYSFSSFGSGLSDLEKLLNTKVTSVSKTPERAFDAAAAIHVITKEDIRRSGLTTIPEILRLAPGVQVARAGSSEWAISVRGFNSQYSNKLLVLIDGRSVYSPISSGVYWDVQDTLIEDIKQIEVIRGPGATLWGANAVNGVINIITEEAVNTQGGYANVVYGNDEKIVSARYGGEINEDIKYRAYAKFTDRASTQDLNGDSSNNDWDSTRAGFRIDTSPSTKDLIRLSGDFHYGNESFNIAYPTLTPPFTQNRVDDEEVKGGNLILNWDRAFDNGSSATLKTYFDYQGRNLPYFAEDRYAYDLDLQYNLKKIGIHNITLGVGYRQFFDYTEGTDFRNYSPSSRTDDLYSAFIQDKMNLIQDKLNLTLGSKFEHNNYTGFEVQPSARIAYTPNINNTFWASVARAIRVPNRNMEDIDFIATGSPSGFVRLAGNPAVDSEELIAYEVGYRTKLGRNLSLDLSAYYNSYDDLASNVFLFPTVITAGNENTGTATGVEFSAKWQVHDKWSLNSSYSYIDIDIEQGNATFVTSSENTPTHQFNIISNYSPTDKIQINNLLYYYHHLEGGEIPAFYKLDSNIKWKASDRLELTLAGQNLLDEEHQEFGSFVYLRDSNIGRSFYLRANYFF